ncbi:MAG: shikimate kinase [Rhodobacteraceae bacterium]|nr:shikimate kinase [Paracoccaceae bacterium]
MSFTVNKTIVVIGLMGAGKTAVGTLVAQKLCVPFMDSDQEIVKAANMSVAEIFERDGEAFFRSKETLVLERLLTGDPCVLATGGGAFVSNENQELISRHGVALWLRADLEILWNRVKHKDTRPLLRTENPYQTLSDLYKQRTPIYARAEIVVDAEQGLSLDAMADKVVSVLAKNPRSGVAWECEA